MTKYPVKARDINNNHIDSTVWDDFAFRDDDIVIGTYAKSGTTWMQQIIGQLIFNGEEGMDVAGMSPWLDMRIPPRQVKYDLLETQTHRRFIKTHLPVDALVFSPKVKYVYIARDGRDVIWSMHNHHLNMTDEIIKILNESGPFDGPPVDQANENVRDYFLEWLDDRGFPVWSFWENIRTWWEIRDLPNVQLIHFNDLKADMEGEIRALADYLDIYPTADAWPRIIEHSSFDYMKAHANEVSPLGGAPFKGGGKTFINKGSNERWRDILTLEDIARYEARAVAELGPECARWLARGRAQ